MATQAVPAMQVLETDWLLELQESTDTCNILAQLNPMQPNYEMLSLLTEYAALATLTGCIRDSNGNPVANATVKLIG